MTSATGNAERTPLVEPRIIKTDEQYRLYLQAVEDLAAGDPPANSPEGERLELLAKLVEDYEKTRYPFAQPDPVDAILFRMEQQGLRQKDIADILGGKNRASEVLARKRPLTLAMIRALHEQLEIPPALLIREPQAPYVTGELPKPRELPASWLVKRGWVDATAGIPQLIQRLAAPAESPLFPRHALVFGANSRTNRLHVRLWLARVREIADARTELHGRFRPAELNEELIRYVSRLSWMDKGPRLAKECLEERGIAVVVEPHLPGTHLDGAALLGQSGAPIIGLTLRADRLDSFWFTLVHELVHAWKHLGADRCRAIADENIESHPSENDSVEREAHEAVAEILFPGSVWQRSAAFKNPTPATLRALAAELQIGPAIVAGRVRYERQNFALFTKLVGYRQARLAFPEVQWG
jgi:HTH-type transcriptional regulator / antitoxin HigA